MRRIWPRLTGAAPARRWRRLPLLATAATMLLGAGGVQDGLQLDTLVRDFDVVAFGAEYRQGTDGRLHKWIHPVHVYLDIRAGQPELYASLTAAHLEQLRDLTGLDISIVDRAEAADVVMVFDRDADLIATAAHYAPSLIEDQVMLSDALCFGHYSHGTGGEIQRAVIGIPTDEAASKGKLPHCIVEETTQVLGLPNDSAEVNPSIFNDKSVLDYLSKHDQTLLRLLYDPRLSAGMPRAEALQLARQILREQGF